MFLAFGRSDPRGSFPVGASYFVNNSSNELIKNVKKKSVAQLCLTRSDPMDYSPPGSSVNSIHQARILEWVAIPFSRGSSQPRD